MEVQQRFAAVASNVELVSASVDKLNEGVEVLTMKGCMGRSIIKCGQRTGNFGCTNKDSYRARLPTLVNEMDQLRPGSRQIFRKMDRTHRRGRHTKSVPACCGRAWTVHALSNDVRLISDHMAVEEALQKGKMGQAGKRQCVYRKMSVWHKSRNQRSMHAGQR